MEKVVVKNRGHRSRQCKTANEAEVLGMTKDGVRILKPKRPATHFTRKELREAIAAVKREKSLDAELGIKE